MPDNGSSTVAKFALAVPGVVVAEKEVVIKGSKAVPAEHVLAPFAHHLSTAGVPLYRNAAHWTPFDVVVAVVWQEEGVHWLASALHQGSAMLSTGEARMPGRRAKAAELFVTGWASHRDTLRLGASADVTNGVAPSRGAPRASRVHRDLRVQPEGAVLVEELLVREPLHLVLGEHSLSWAIRVRTRDVVGALHHLERYVLLHALFAKGAAALVQLDHGGGGAVVAADLA